MRKLTMLLAALAVVGAMTVPAAQAAGNSQAATLSVTVNATCVLSFSDDVENFGARNAGTTTEADPAFSYSVASNVVSEISINVGSLSGNLGTGGKFQLRKGETTGSYTDLPTAGVSQLGGAPWRTSIASGATNFTDDAAAVVGLNAATGAVSQTLTYATSCS